MRPARATPDRLRRDLDEPVDLVRPGEVPYRVAWDWQRQLVDHRRDGAIRDTLVLLTHPPVYTAGRRADAANLLWDETERARHGIDLVRVDRGGDITYHGPGQVVGYPILRLAGPNVVDYVRALEDVGIRVLARYGLRGERSRGATGVWVGDRKVMAIGVRVSSGYVTQHGFALNVTTDLGHFDGIVPCGIRDRGVCSLASLGVDTDVASATDHVAEAFAETFGCTLQRRPDAAVRPLSVDAGPPPATRSA